MKLFGRPTIYVSHPIRGTKGDVAMAMNCARAIKAAKKLRTVFPEIDFYVPAESDTILQLLYHDKKLTDKEILDADLKIVDACHGWIFLHWDESSGGEKERDEASAIDLPMLDVKDDVSKMNYGRIRSRFLDVVEATKKYYKENR